MPDTDSSPAVPSRYTTFILLGAPGCGKGTQGRVMGNIPRFHYFSCGDAFRSLDTRTELGRKFVSFSSKGQLVPDELTIELWQTQIAARIATSEFKPDIDLLLLDGIPRTVHQAELMEPFVDVAGVFHLSCPNRDELARRIRKRALKENRPDDASETVIRSRFETYEAETKPILDHYEDVVIDIDASQAPVKVLWDILERIMGTAAWKEQAKETI